ncbi:hypothetical protein [Filimonas effusa]|uniref:Uncharacterized protein n=1 Tax=Filimonas effusa TaxID=2508721 RepID=A0A4Q1DBT0_9BACT|nr:hypothetical protein [Filimonas effusa]RXK86053.1 hypothetical protein ESB13_04380 [Filimonas effusa]
MKIGSFLAPYLALLLGSQSLHAQNRPETPLRNYSTAVIARVAEVSALTGLPVERQKLLADYYNRRDSLMASLASTAGTSADRFRSLADSMTRELDDLLRGNERVRYYEAIHNDYFNWEAVETAAWLRKKYHISPHLQTVIYAFIKEKNEGLNKVFSAKATNDISPVTHSLLNHYDSLSAIYKTAAVGQLWLEQKLKELDAISPLGEKEKQLIEDQFLALCLKKGGGYDRNFKAALQFASGKKEYFNLLYRDSIRQLAEVRGEKELQDMSYKYGLPELLVRKIRPLVLEKCRKDQEYQSRMPYGRQRDSLEKDNSERSWAAIKQVLIRAGYFRLGDSRYTAAMRYQKALALTNEQMDSLAAFNYQLDISTYIYSLIDPWIKLDASVMVGMKLEKLLRPGQYDTLLKIESHPHALTATQKDWSNLKKYNMVTEQDSAAVFTTVFFYHLSQTVVQRRYLHNPTLARQIGQRLIDSKPAILRKLDAAIKMNEYNNVSMN